MLLVVSTRAANKVMPNGMNAHLTVRPADWWVGFFDATIGRRFTMDRCHTDHVRADCTLAYVARDHE